MPQLIEWSDDYLIGLDEIDAQHKRLTQLINNTLRLIYRHSPKEQVAESFQTTIQYATWHFNSEETLMKIYDFPEYDEHCEDHVYLLNGLEKKFEQINRIILNPDKLYTFFAGWFGAHAFGSDKDMVLFMQEKLVI